MTYKEREEIYKAASARREGREGQKIYAFGIAGLEDRRSAGTGVECNRSILRKSIEA